MTIRRAFLLGLGGLLILTAGAFAVSAANSERANCPGKVICPLSGEIVCKDQCPAVDPNRPDCPGKIICPLTGELICKDECPAGEMAGECCKLSCCGTTATTGQ